jgi:hypothetical protein
MGNIAATCASSLLINRATFMSTNTIDVHHDQWYAHV